ncbi:muscular LMNA-interacting protein isoform X4 [Scleropages formosus]|uniref:muscular LMNA-interacting protein isoform X4 n=1 Tax=Scleropages formosus TaxID=113540 RepID=UPI0010FA7B61|nr:muscular LMNA-interacting protein isoform X4 [Scleropages formosus]
MAKDTRAALPGSDDQGLQKVPTEVSPARLLCFTFVPVVKQLPLKTQVNPRGDRGDPSSRPSKAVDPDVPRYPDINPNQAAGQKMTEDGFFKAEVVYIGDSDEGEAGGLWARQNVDDLSIQEETQAQFKIPADHITQSSPTTPPISLRTKTCFINMSPVPRPPALDIFSGSQSSAALSCRRVSPCGEVSSPSLSNRVCGEGERATPVLSPEVPSSEEGSPSLASSKESVLSKDWGRPESCSSTLQQFTSERSLVSPCPSVGSGVFSPTLLKVSRHSLASGSSLAQAIPSCFTSSDSLAPSPRPLSPSTGRPRRRPPPTRLSLLTAILRKGRLPLLSPSLQRPYSPCWPISPASLSSCKACSAASSLSSIASTLQGSSRPQSPSSAERPTKPPLTALEAFRPSCPPSHHTESTCPPHIQSTAPFAKLHQNKPVTAINHRVTSARSPPSSLDRTDPVKTTFSGLHNLPPPVPGPVRLPSFPRLSSPSPKSTSSGDRPRSFPLLTVTPAKEDKEAGPSIPVQNVSKESPPKEPSQSFRPTPPPRSSSLSPPLCLSTFTPRWSSPRPSSPSSVSDCLTPPAFSSSSPALWTRAPSPSLSLSSTASLSSEHRPSGRTVDREGKKRKPYKIKSSYKALAAIPTNTLLLEQQAIDESVENEELSQDNTDKKDILETHSEMCSPSQFRQQSEELYAAIDEVLENPMPMRRSQSAPIALMKCVDPEVSKQFRYFPKSAGRETKYTKPGVIRPATVIPKLQIEEDAEEFHPNPFRQYLEEILEKKVKHEHQVPSLPIHEKEALHSQEVSSRQSEQPVKVSSSRGSPASRLPSQETLNQGGATAGPKITITKTDEGDAHSTKDEPLKHPHTLFHSTQLEAELQETHI